MENLDEEKISEEREESDLPKTVEISTPVCSEPSTNADPSIKDSHVIASESSSQPAEDSVGVAQSPQTLSSSNSSSVTASSQIAVSQSSVTPPTQQQQQQQQQQFPSFPPLNQPPNHVFPPLAFPVAPPPLPPPHLSSVFPTALHSLPPPPPHLAHTSDPHLHAQYYAALSHHPFAFAPPFHLHYPPPPPPPPPTHPSYHHHHHHHTHHHPVNFAPFEVSASAAANQTQQQTVSSNTSGITSPSSTAVNVKEDGNDDAIDVDKCETDGGNEDCGANPAKRLRNNNGGVDDVTGSGCSMEAEASSSHTDMAMMMMMMMGGSAAGVSAGGAGEAGFSRKQPLQVRQAEFKAFLEEQNVSAFSTWGTESARLAATQDSRFSALSGKDRKAAFEQFVQSRVELEGLALRRKLQEKRNKFNELLEHWWRSSSSAASCSFNEFCARYSRDERFKSVDKMKEREALFTEFVNSAAASSGTSSSSANIAISATANHKTAKPTTTTNTSNKTKKKKEDPKNDGDAIKSESPTTTSKATKTSKPETKNAESKKKNEKIVDKVSGSGGASGGSSAAASRTNFLQFLCNEKIDKYCAASVPRMHLFDVESEYDLEYKHDEAEHEAMEEGECCERRGGGGGRGNENTELQRTLFNEIFSSCRTRLASQPEWRCVASDALRRQWLHEYLRLSTELRGLAEADRQARQQSSIRERERQVRDSIAAAMRDRDRQREQSERETARAAFKALLTEMVRDPRHSWSTAKHTLHRVGGRRWDEQCKPHLDRADRERIFREHRHALEERQRATLHRMLFEADATATSTSRHTDARQLVAASWKQARHALLVLLEAASEGVVPAQSSAHMEREATGGRDGDGAVDEEKEKGEAEKDKTPVDQLLEHVMLDEKTLEQEFESWKRAQLKSAKSKLRELLKETRSITHKTNAFLEEDTSNWEEIIRPLQDDIRYKNMAPFPEKRREIILDHLSDLEHQRNHQSRR